MFKQTLIVLLFAILIVFSAWSQTENVGAEAESCSGSGTSMTRSAASGQQTRFLNTDEDIRCTLVVVTPGYYRITIRYSNDNDNSKATENIALSLNGVPVSPVLPTEDTGDSGVGWNTFRETMPSETALLSAGSHTMQVLIQGGDGYGIEIDSVELTLEQPVTPQTTPPPTPTFTPTPLPSPDVDLLAILPLMRVTTWGENHTYPTQCAEEDNVNIPLFREISPPAAAAIGLFDTFTYQIVATHPRYEIGIDNGDPDFTNCNFDDAALPVAEPPDGFDNGGTCQDADCIVKCWELLNDGNNVVNACYDRQWFRTSGMGIQAYGGGALLSPQLTRFHRLVLHRKTPGVDSWPQVFVLYEDGNSRLKPLPPIGRADTFFGSSVIIGPAAVSQRPIVDLENISVFILEDEFRTPCISVTYINGEHAQLCLVVNQERAILHVWVGYNTAAVPFATFRSMVVADDNADVSHARVQSGHREILGIQGRLEGSEWWFYRQVRSRHNTSAPDILIRVNP